MSLCSCAKHFLGEWGGRKSLIFPDILITTVIHLANKTVKSLFYVVTSSSMLVTMWGICCVLQKWPQSLRVISALFRIPLRNFLSAVEFEREEPWKKK